MAEIAQIWLEVGVVFRLVVRGTLPLSSLLARCTRIDASSALSLL
jgi:hypothetical protein